MKLVSTVSGVLLATLLVNSAAAQTEQAPPAWQWVQRLGVATASANAIGTDAAGNVYVAGSFLGTARFGGISLTSPANNSYGDGYLLKMNGQGEVIWVRQITGIREEVMSGLAVDDTGTVTIVGTLQYDAAFDATTTLRGATADSPDLFVARYDANGTLQWARSYGGPTAGTDRLDGNAVTVDAAGNVYAAGSLQGAATVGNSQLTNPMARPVPVLIKLAADGTTSWAQQGQLADGPTATSGGAIAVRADANGNTTMCGTFTGRLSWGSTTLEAASAHAEVFVARFDAAGKLVWARQSSGSTTTRPSAIGLDAAGNAYVTGDYEGSLAFGTLQLGAAPQPAGYLVKYDAAGVPQWGRSTSGGLAFGQRLAVTATGEAYVAGRFTGNLTLSTGISLRSTGNQDVFVASYDAQGTPRWAQQAGSGADDAVSAIEVDRSGRIYVTGYCQAGASFAPLVMTDLGAPFIARLGGTTIMASASSHLPLLFSPNPAATVVQLPALATGSTVELVDALGRIVRTATTTGSAMRHQFSVAGVVPGAYMLRATEPTGKRYMSRLEVR